MRGIPTYQKLSEVLGLSKYESKVYLASVELKSPANLTTLAKQAKIPRTAMYSPVQALVEKGLMSLSKFGKRTVYQALDPRRLESLLSRKKIDLSDIVSELSRDIISSEEDFSIRHFIGKQGMASVCEIFLAETKTKMWKTFETASFDPDNMDVPQFEDYIKRRADKKIFAKVIISTRIVYPWLKKRLENNKEEFRENLIVSDDEYPFEGAIAVTKGMVGYLSTANKPFAVIIKSEQMARTIESIHDLIWNRIKGKNS